MSLSPLFAAPLVVQLHAALAVLAFALGLFQLLRRKGGRIHRSVGWIWVAIMCVVAMSSFFIHEICLWGPFSPIHLLSVMTLGMLICAIIAVRKGYIRAHGIIMVSMFFGALVGAGSFALLPGRLMNDVVMNETRSFYRDCTKLEVTAFVANKKGDQIGRLLQDI